MTTVQKIAYDQCKLCLTPRAKLAFKTPRFDLLVCSECRHLFSYVKVHPEHYEGDYFFDKQKEYFTHPDIKLFDYMHQLVFQCRPNLKSKLTMLDAGTAIGVLPQHFNSMGYQSFGIDISQDAILYGAEKLSIPRLEAIAIQNFKPNFLFNVIICNNVIEHVEDPNSFFREVRRLLADEGLFLCITVNSDSLIFALAKWIYQATRGVCFQFLERVCEVHHLHHFNERSLEKSLENSGFRVIKRFGWNLPTNSISVTPIQKFIISFLYQISKLTNSYFLQGVVCVKK